MSRRALGQRDAALRTRRWAHESLDQSATPQQSFEIDGLAIYPAATLGRRTATDRVGDRQDRRGTEPARHPNVLKCWRVAVLHL